MRLGVLLLFLTAVLWPVCKLTLWERNGPTEQSPPTLSSIAAASQRRNGTQQATLILHGAPCPLHCSIRQQDKVLLTEKDAFAPGEYRTIAKISNGEDLLITANWPNGDLHALRAEVSVTGTQTLLEKTFWARQSLEDTVTIPENFR